MNCYDVTLQRATYKKGSYFIVERNGSNEVYKLTVDVENVLDEFLVAAENGERFKSRRIGDLSEDVIFPLINSQGEKLNAKPSEIQYYPFPQIGERFVTPDRKRCFPVGWLDAPALEEGVFCKVLYDKGFNLGLRFGNEVVPIGQMLNYPRFYGEVPPTPITKNLFFQ